MDIIELFNQNKQIADWQRNLNKSTRQLLMGLSFSTKIITMASCVESNHKILILTSTYSEAEKLSSDLIGLVGEEKVYLFFSRKDFFSFRSSRFFIKFSTIRVFDS